MEENNQDEALHLFKRLKLLISQLPFENKLIKSYEKKWQPEYTTHIITLEVNPSIDMTVMFIERTPKKEIY